MYLHVTLRTSHASTCIVLIDQIPAAIINQFTFPYFTVIVFREYNPSYNVKTGLLRVVEWVALIRFLFGVCHY